MSCEPIFGRCAITTKRLDYRDGAEIERVSLFCVDEKQFMSAGGFKLLVEVLKRDIRASYCGCTGFAFASRFYEFHSIPGMLTEGYSARATATVFKQDRIRRLLLH